MKKMKTILFFVMLAPSFTWGYTASKIDITIYEFRRYIIPQLKSILSDYHSVIKNYANTQTSLLNQRQKFQLLKSNYKQIAQLCPNVLDQKCVKDLKELLKKSKELEQMSLAEILLLKPTDELFIDQTVTLTKLNTSITNISIHIENVLTSIGLAENLEKNKTIMLKNYISEYALHYHLYSMTQIQYEYYEYFKTINAQFIFPIEEKILFDESIEFLVYNMNPMNSAWHDFNMYFQKKDKKTPKKIETFLNTMNNRWNSILKLSLIQSRP